MAIKRDLEKTIISRLFNKKVIVIVGPRQVGKTTLLQIIANLMDKRKLFLNCDEPDIRRKLDLPTSTQLKAIVGDAEIILIDEAQRVRDIGITLKLLIDSTPEKQIIVTGSSALELSNLINEPLTGRKYEYKLYPFSFSELSKEHGFLYES